MTEKKKLNGGDVLIKSLLAEKVRYLFGIPGGQFLNMYDAVYNWGREHGIDTVMFRHEQAAAHAADAWARVTNTPGICFGTVGPGATHLVAGIGAAWSDNIPVIAICAQVNSKYDDTYTLQGNLDQITLFKPITKYQRSIRDIEKIPDAVRKSFREATGGKPRPVLLEIYEDAFLEEIGEDELDIFDPNRYRATNKPSADADTIKKAINMLIDAKKPLIVSGGGVARSEAWNELQQFAEHLKIPVVTTIMGIGTISNESKCLIGTTINTAATMQAARDADVILALGCKFSYTMGHGQEPLWKNDQKLIHVDIDSTIIGRNKPVSLGVVADAKNFLSKMLEIVKKEKKIEEREWLNTLASMIQGQMKSTLKKASRDKVPIVPQKLVADVFEFMDQDAILIFDGGDIAVFVQEQMDFHKPRPPLSTICSVGMGHLGTAVPYAIGAKLAKPDKQVIAIAGDGSFMINIQDLETAVRLGLKNIIWVVGNNSAWGMIKSGQKLFMKKHYIDVDIPDFDFAKCAEGFGCYAEKVTEPDQIIEALNRAKNSEKPAVIDVKIKFVTPEGTKMMGAMGIL
ncbi:MAG: thiamine pyrophosphate-binding protein [Candidatus Lokiarchaeota archaeon]|nr:thiamine pyrophosphate-binding protein [Candidatus Lokiarchaeota archaeon]